MPKAAQFRTM